MTWFTLGLRFKGFFTGLLIAAACGGCCYFLTKLLAYIFFVFAGQVVGFVFWSLVILPLSRYNILLVINQALFVPLFLYLGHKYASGFLILLTSFMGSIYIAAVFLSMFNIPLSAGLGAWFWIGIPSILIFTAAGIYAQRHQGFHLTQDALDNNDHKDDHFKQVAENEALHRG